VVGAVARGGRYLAVLRSFPLPQTKAFVAESIKKKRPYFLALAGKKVVGWCDIIEKPRELLAHSGVLGLGVLASHRGRGVGAALMARTLADAKTKGFKRVELTVRADNDRAKALYEKAGFEVEGLCRRHMRVRGRYYDSYLMALLFD
jgi:RimJ/RimL family protein N-acetyltransferase